MSKSGNLVIHKLSQNEFNFIKEQLVREMVRYDTVLKKDPKQLSLLESNQGLKQDRLKATFERFNKVLNTVTPEGRIVVELNNSHTRAVQRVLTAYIRRCILIEDEYTKRMDKEESPEEKVKLREYKDKLPILCDFAKQLFVKMEG